MFECLTEELAFIGIHDVMIPILLFFVSLGLGLITEKVGIAYFQKLAQKTEFEGDDRIADALKGMPTLWGVLVGVAVVFHTTTISAKYVGTINKALLVIAIFSVTRIVEKMVSTFMDHLVQKTGHAVPSTSIFNNIIKLSIYILGALMALHVLGVSITPLITALGIGGLAVALALQSTLANLFAGIQIILSKQVNIGDYIRIGNGEEGYVTDITWRNTTITALQNNVIIVPNSNMATLNIVNYGCELQDLSFPTVVGVSYDCDLDHVERVLVELILQMQKDFADQMPEFEPILRFGAFTDSSIPVTIHLRTKAYGFQFALRSEFVKRIHKRFKQEHIEIPFSARPLHVNPNAMAKETLS